MNSRDWVVNGQTRVLFLLRLMWVIDSIMRKSIWLKLLLWSRKKFHLHKAACKPLYRALHSIKGVNVGVDVGCWLLTTLSGCILLCHGLGLHWVWCCLMSSVYSPSSWTVYQLHASNRWFWMFYAIVESTFVRLEIEAALFSYFCF